MYVHCPKCKKEYDVGLFEFGRSLICACGQEIGLVADETLNQLASLCRQYELRIEEEKLEKIRRVQDRIVFHILNQDYPEVDIEIEKVKFRELINELFPEKVHLYELIYESRFKRLREQFREGIIK